MQQAQPGGMRVALKVAATYLLPAGELTWQNRVIKHDEEIQWVSNRISVMQRRAAGCVQEDSTAGPSVPICYGAKQQDLALRLIDIWHRGRHTTMLYCGWMCEALQDVQSIQYASVTTA